MELSTGDRALISREVRRAQDALVAAQSTTDALQTLTHLTAAVEGLTATQHELVNTLLDRGATWTEVADALSTSRAAAQRRYPRRGRREN